MRVSPRQAPILILAGLGAGLVACGMSDGQQCLALPCPFPMAITINVTAAAGGSVVVEP